MKKIIILLAGLGLASCSLDYLDTIDPGTMNRGTINRQSRTSKNKAWAKTTWGMSPDQVEKVVKQELSLIDQESKAVLCYEEHAKYCDGGQIPNYSIGSQNYRVAFTFIYNQLNAVYLTCLDDKFVCHTELGNLLEAKYGKPTDFKVTPHEVAENSTKIWSLESGDIKLFRSVCTPKSKFFNKCSESTDFTTLQYIPNPQHFQAKTPEFDPEIDKNKI